MKPIKEDLQKHTLNLRAGDYERLQSLYPEVGAALVIRKIVSAFLDRDTAEIDTSKMEISL